MAPHRKFVVEIAQQDQAAVRVHHTCDRPPTTPWTYVTGRLQADLARAQRLGYLRYKALNGPAIAEAARACRKLHRELQRFYDDRNHGFGTTSLYGQPADHPVRRLVAEFDQLFTGPHYHTYRAGQREAEPRMNWPEKNGILRTAQRFIEADEAEVEAEFRGMLAAAADWTSRVRAYMDQIIAAEKAEVEKRRAADLQRYREMAEEIRNCLRHMLPIPRFNLETLRTHNLLSAAEIAAVEASREAESRTYWFDLYDRGELPNGIVPYTPNWERWLDSQDYDRWMSDLDRREDSAFLKSFGEEDERELRWQLQDRLAAVHDKRLRRRFKSLGKNCRDRSM